MKTLSELQDLTGRKALVIGGAGHIGRVVCDTLDEMGAQVMVIDLASARKNGAYPFIAGDLTDEKRTRQAIRKGIQTLKGLSILVHCAAFVGTTRFPGWAVPFSRQTVKAWDAGLRVNLTSAFVAVQEARLALAKSGHGSAILFSSIYGVAGPDFRLYEGTSMSNPAAYGASKGGLLQLTRSLATTLAPRVRANAISPGGVLRGQPKGFQKKYVERTPLRRMATEQDLKGAVAFLASDLSEYVTGQNLVVDGGWTAW